MKISLCADAADMGRRASEIVVDLLTRTPDAVLGLATGSSPEPLYRELIRRHQEQGVDFSQATAFTLDEYVGLPAEHEQSYRSTIRRELTDAVGLPPQQLHTPQGQAEDLDAEARRYEAALEAAGGVDVQVLGLGANGHIGFNEPSSSLGSQTRVKTLSARTREDNARFFASPDDVPHLCLTQGLGTIGRSKLALMLVQGEHKAEAVHRMVEGPVSASCPASVLQFHRRAVVLLDEAAASRLEDLEYYRHVQSIQQSLEQ